MGAADSQFAFLIQNSAARQPHELRTVTFRIGRGGFPREPFRLRIYQYNDDPDAPPGKELLTEYFNISSAIEGECTYNLIPYNIVATGRGFFMALEFIAGADKFYTQHPILNYSPTGPVLRPPRARFRQATSGSSRAHRASP